MAHGSYHDTWWTSACHPDRLSLSAFARHEAKVLRVLVGGNTYCDKYHEGGYGHVQHNGGVSSGQALCLALYPGRRVGRGNKEEMVFFSIARHGRRRFFFVSLTWPSLRPLSLDRDGNQVPVLLILRGGVNLLYEAGEVDRYAPTADTQSPVLGRLPFRRNER